MRAGGSPCGRTRRRSAFFATPRFPFSYLDFAGAARAVEEARREAAELGEPTLAPSRALEDCAGRHTIETALASPRASFGGVEKYRTLPAKAAVLTYTLAKSQACPDGNKRIALILLRAFLYINAARLVAPDREIAHLILEAADSDRAARDAMIAAMTTWLEEHLEVSR